EGPGGWFRGPKPGEQTVLVFRRAREGLGPRIAASHEAMPEPDLPVAPMAAPVTAPERPERPEWSERPERVVLPPRGRDPARRIEPAAPGGSEADGYPTPLRPS